MIHYCYIIDVIAMFGPSYCRLLPDYHQPSLHLRMISLASSEVHGDQRGKGFFPYPYPTSPFQRATHQQDLVPGCWSWAKVWRMWGHVLLPSYISTIVSHKIMSTSVVLDLHSLYNLVEKAGTLTHYPADPESTWTYSGKQITHMGWSWFAFHRYFLPRTSLLSST